MKALIVYASWFGHNRAVAQRLATELTNRGMTVVCAPASRITASDVHEFDLLVLGTYTHAGKASPQLHALCEAIPLHQLERTAVALFGTQMLSTEQAGMPGGIDELHSCLTERGCELVAEPLRFGLRGTAAAFLPLPWLGADERHQIDEFASDLWDASVPAPLI
jgi:flavodoxin